MDVMTIANYSTCLAEAIVAFMLFEAFLARREGFPKYVYIAGVLALSLLTQICNSIFSYTALNTLLVHMLELLVSFIYKGKFRYRLVCSVLSFSIAYVGEMLALVLIILVTGQDAAVIIDVPAYRSAGIILTDILVTVIGVFVFRWLGNTSKPNMKRYWYLFLLMFFSLIINFFALFTIITSTTESHLRAIMLIAFVSLTAITVAIMYTYNHAVKQQDVMMRQRLERQQLKEQINRYNVIMSSQEDIKHLRHDLKNHLLAVDMMIKSDKTEEAREYIEALIEKQTGAALELVNTDNEAFNAIANAKLTDCEKLGIKPVMRVMTGALAGLTFDEIVILFGNLFDNAIAAAGKSERRLIELDVKKRRDQLFILMKNSIDGSVLETNPTLATTKDDKESHGMGIRNMRKIAEAHGGSISFYEEDGFFCCDILM